MKRSIIFAVLLILLISCTKKEPFIPRLEIKAEALVLWTAEKYKIEPQYPWKDSVLKKPATYEIVFRFTFTNDQDRDSADIRAIYYNRVYVHVDTPDTTKSITYKPFIMDRQIEIGRSDDFEVREFDFNKKIVEERIGANSIRVREEEGMFNYEEFIFQNNPDSIATITISIDYEGELSDFAKGTTPKYVMDNRATFIIPPISQLNVCGSKIDVSKYKILKKK